MTAVYESIGAFVWLTIALTAGGAFVAGPIGVYERLWTWKRGVLVSLVGAGVYVTMASLSINYG